MAIPRPMMLGDEPVNTPPPVLDDNDSIFSSKPRSTRVAQETRTFAPDDDTTVVETRTYDPALATPVDTDGDGVADEGIFGAAPVYAARTSDRSGGGKKVALIAIPALALVLAGGLLLSSPNHKAPLTAAPVATNTTPAPAGMPATTPPSPSQVAEATPAPASTSMVATPSAARSSTPARQTATARRAAAPRATSADTTASDASATVAAPPPPIDTPPPVLSVPDPTPVPATPTSPPETTPPQ